MKSILIALIALSCASSDLKDPVVSEPLLERLREKFNVYIELASRTQDRTGFLYAHDCDSLLFTGLYGAVPGTTVELKEARDAHGMWHRRPLYMGECYPDESSSTISRDMLDGVLYYAWANNDGPMIEDLIRAGEANDWIMGEGDISRTFVNPGMRGTIRWLDYKLSGNNHPNRTNPLFTPLFTGRTNGYEAHLEVLHINLRAELEGSISASWKRILKSHADRQPNNALFQAMFHRWDDGDQGRATSLLLQEKHWPAERLPGTSEHCEQWLYQRDEEPRDWLPCPGKNKTHSGGDWLFAASLILNVQDR